MSLNLVPRDLELLDTLSLRVRLLTVRQVAELWWPSGSNQRRVWKRLEQLAAHKLVEIHRVNAHPLLPVSSPIFAWQPGKEEPDCEKLSEQCRMRWHRPSQPMTVCVAAPRTANCFGSTAAGLPKQEHLNHDLRLAAVYAAYRLQRPELAALWIGEHALPKAGYRIKDPDAFLRRGDGQPFRVIESAGRYSTDQVQSFHEHCESHGLAYELW